MSGIKRGFSLIEVLIVIAILGVLLSMGFLGMQRYLNTIRLSEARMLLAQELSQARTDARKKSADQTISWTVGSGSFSIGGQTVTLPNNVTLIQVNGTNSTSVTFTGPFGRLQGDNVEFIIQSPQGKQASVRLLGVTGKVMQRDL